MSWRAIWREAWRNVASGAARPVLLAALASLVVLVAQLSDLAAVAAADARAEAFRAAGADVLVVQSSGGIDASRCRALVQVAGVEAAGAIRADEPRFAASAPGSSIPTFEVTPEFGAVLGTKTSGAGVLLSSEAASMLDAAMGERLPLIDGSTAVGGVYRYPSDGRMLGLGFAMLVPTTDPGHYDACWMRTWPAADAHQMLLQTVATGASDTPPDLRQLNPRLGAELDAASAFHERPTRLLPLAGALALAAIGAGAVLLRKLELASARHLGVSREALAAGIGLSLLAPFAGAIGALAGGAITAASIRERDVYRSFRQR
ncbi:hypothetical protein [Agrococcus beijingensis]|uniref:hypothetical protein n=1 Tax=Agrococcus beijingensis TaxID=3068634 RepID=UPI0027418FF0|nr:hypothetical protein [Agrococcus sp. REN33]